MSTEEKAMTKCSYKVEKKAGKRNKNAYLRKCLSIHPLSIFLS
jgi:hypothetical protein